MPSVHVLHSLMHCKEVRLLSDVKHGNPECTSSV